MLKELYSEYSGCEPTEIIPLAESGSNRKYFRIKCTGKRTVIGMQGEDAEENEAFITLDRHFRAKGLPVPEVLAVSADGMCCLQEDLGDTSLFDFLSPCRAEGVFDTERKEILKKTVSLLADFQFKGAEGLDFNICYPQAAFDDRMVSFDLNYFKYSFLKPSGTPFNENRLQDDFDRFKSDLLDCCDTETFMYRDFQSRNVMIHDGEPYFIDFQGGRKGPSYYDLASFLWQAKAAYPDSLKEELISCYLESLGKYTEADTSLFMERLELFVLFRTLQVLGAYGYRGLFERKEHFISSIPGALDNLNSLLGKGTVDAYPYLKEILERLVCRMTPKPLPDISCLTVEVSSFSFRKGIPQCGGGIGGGYVFDCRGMENPGRYEQYKSMTGRDAPVISFLEEKGEVQKFLANAFQMVDPHVENYIKRNFGHMVVNFGCTGGQHRSVYCAEHMAQHLRTKYPMIKVVLYHTEHPNEI